MKASVDEDGCISCGLCTNVCPEVFQFAPSGKAHAVTAVVPSECEETAEDARDGCPVSVIDLN